MDAGLPVERNRSRLVTTLVGLNGPKGVMLYEFLVQEKDSILKLCADKHLAVHAAGATSAEMQVGLPIFYSELVEVLRADEDRPFSDPDASVKSLHHDNAVRVGKESLRLGYTISQVVHGYGALCQAITEHADAYGGEPIAAREFNRLNYCLDSAIAQAVTEFNSGLKAKAETAEVERLGSLAHELRNALASISTAHYMLKTGKVGFSGSTNQILESGLQRMQDLIDRSLSEVRLRGEPLVELELCRVVDLVGEVEATSLVQAEPKRIRLHVEVSPRLTVRADRHLTVSALSNLVQNAIKFTHEGGTVFIRARSGGDRVHIEVEDRCGGLPPGKIESLFQPYVQKSGDKSGVGLGLSIARRAIASQGGAVTAWDLPGTGCVFRLDLPAAVNDSEPDQHLQVTAAG